MSSHDDDRGGVPSASSMERVAHCPSSYNFEKMFPEPPKKADDISIEGELLHDIVMGIKPLSLATPSQQDDIISVRRKRNKLIRETIGEYDESRGEESRKLEQRLWLHDGLKPILSGRFDELLIAYPDSPTSPCLLIDYKFGYKDVEEAVTNMQLRSQAVLVYNEWGYRDIYCAIIPRLGKPTVANYEEYELEVSKQSLIDISHTAMDTENLGRLCAGEWCAYCKARHACPASWGISGTKVKMTVGGAYEEIETDEGTTPIS